MNFGPVIISVFVLEQEYIKMIKLIVQNQVFNQEFKHITFELHNERCILEK